MQDPVLLGPQRPKPNAPAALADVATGQGTVVVLAAGWRADETDDEALRRYLGPDVAVLPVYNWFDVVMREIPDLRKEYRARQDALAELRRLHRLRMHPALDVLHDFLSSERTPLEEEHLQLVLEDIRRIDRQLLEFAAKIHARHAAASAPWTASPVVERLRDRAASALRQARAVVITGGHVAVLLNRLQFFGADQVLRELHGKGRPILAWSAGSMVLSDRIVLYYDDPPDGPAFPELLDYGFGLAKDVVLLPHARQRLRLDDPVRVGALALRFGPQPCIGLENGAWLAKRNGRWYNRGEPGSAIQLHPNGSVETLAAWEGP